MKALALMKLDVFMANAYDLNIAFELPEFKLLFTELFLKKLSKPLKTRIRVTDAKKKNAYKDLISSSKWISITFFDIYFENKFWRRNHIEFCDLVFNFFEFLFVTLKGIETRFLFKIIFISKNGYKFNFLFEQIHGLNFLKTNVPKQ